MLQRGAVTSSRRSISPPFNCTHNLWVRFDCFAAVSACVYRSLSHLCSLGVGRAPFAPELCFLRVRVSLTHSESLTRMQPRTRVYLRIDQSIA